MTPMLGEVSTTYQANSATNKVPTGYKITEVGVIPEEWNCVVIGELITDLRGGAPFKPTDFTKDGVKVLPKGGVIRGGLLRILEKDQQFCSPSFASKYAKNRVNENYTIVVLRDLVPSGPSIGLMVKITNAENFILAQGVYGFLAKNESISAFLIQYSNTNKYRRAANEIMVGSTQVHITNGAFKEIKIAIPSDEKEQTAIANALSDVDALISELEKLIAKKQAIKTATMQQLLTGRTRLPQFALREDGTPKGTKPSELGEIPEDWEVHSLSSICDVRDGTHDSPKYKDNGIPLVTSKNIVDDILDLSNVSLISPEDAFEIDKRSKVDKGDIIMSMIGTVGSAVLLLEEPKFCIKNVALFKPKKVSGEFLVQLIRSKIFQDYLEDSMDGGIQKFVSLGTLRNMEISLPSEQEQTAIASILSDMDNEIQALEQRLGKTRQIKQGMMQELLTGKTRLIKPSKEVIHE
ncbi:restriction endonuclease subunit S [Vibrio cholerae]|nr:restriction endonuclease subunit S [Vibrio cholerae]EGR2017047.1 restriction endonuclease subunit S [Vibrio cholerae]EGR2445264.1 restriction endonuclease subunit S [Vibrio cholerae]